MSTKDGRFCPSCNFAIRDGAKFCPNCGAKAPEIMKPTAGRLNIHDVREGLSEISDDEEDAIYTIELQVDERSQLVFVAVYEDDGESEYDRVVIWSIFASVDDVTLKDALSAVKNASFGMKRLADSYVLYTSARIEGFSSVDAIIQLVHWVAIQADAREQELLGTDEY
jgi:uncharacterized Zn finger protein (UPF0148 family)